MDETSSPPAEGIAPDVGPEFHSPARPGSRSVHLVALAVGLGLLVTLALGLMDHVAVARNLAIAGALTDGERQTVVAFDNGQMFAALRAGAVAAFSKGFVGVHWRWAALEALGMATLMGLLAGRLGRGHALVVPTRTFLVVSGLAIVLLLLQSQREFITATSSAAVELASVQDDAAFRARSGALMVQFQSDLEQFRGDVTASLAPLVKDVNLIPEPAAERSSPDSIAETDYIIWHTIHRGVDLTGPNPPMATVRHVSLLLGWSLLETPDASVSGLLRLPPTVKSTDELAGPHVDVVRRLLHLLVVHRPELVQVLLQARGMRSTWSEGRMPDQHHSLLVYVLDESARSALQSAATAALLGHFVQADRAYRALIPAQIDERAQGWEGMRWVLTRLDLGLELAALALVWLLVALAVVYARAALVLI